MMTGIILIMIGRKINYLNKNVFFIYNKINSFFYGKKFRHK